MLIRHNPSRIIVVMIFLWSFFTVSSCGIDKAAGRPYPPSVQSQDLDELNREFNPYQWKAGSLAGLTTGKATENDVKGKFGDASFRGPNAEKVFVRDAEPEILLQYKNATIDGENRHLDVVIGAQSKLVKAFTVYPGADRPDRAGIEVKYGTNFFEVGSADSLCISKNQIIGKTVQQRERPYVLVYPNLGIYVSVAEDDRMGHVGYLMKCLTR